MGSSSKPNYGARQDGTYAMGIFRGNRSDRLVVVRLLGSATKFRRRSL
jgi:hypothetical protein